MSMTNISGSSTQASSSVNSKQPANKNEGGKKTADDVLAALRDLMPGWTISTTTADWGEGFRNIQIDPAILERMANDPKEFEKYKAMILEFENVVGDLEKWGQENPGQSIIFQLSLDAAGKATSLSIVKTLMGAETRTAFDLPEGRETWADIIRDRVEALIQGKFEEADGSKSWIT